MSSIYKLSLKGIRAFEPEHDETIQFGFPLTLICGQNGCGKTTIIECLRYATTGNLPPNSKGGAFVHDPGLSSRVAVHGEVKLAFKNANGKSMITTRSVSATMKKGGAGGGAGGNGGLTFKTLEGQLAYIEKGQKTAISSKNAEMDAQIPIFLGASPAILDNVIFCHQDDSLWPLSEASVLKKKFDDIFEASKFTKVIDNLKTIKRDMSVDIKLIEQSVNHLKIDKDRAKKVKDKLAQMTQSVDHFTMEISELNIKIEKKEKEADQLFATNQEFQKTLSDYENLLMKKESLEESIEKLKTTITILQDTDEELYHKQENFASINTEKSAKIEELQTESFDLEKQLKDKSAISNELIRLDGSLKAKKAEYESNQKKINDIIHEHAALVKYLEQDNISVASFKKSVEESLASAKRQQNDFVVESKAKESIQQSKYQDVCDSILKNEQTCNYLSQEVSSNQQTLLTLKRKLDVIASDENDLTVKRTELEQINQELSTKKKLNEVKSFDSKIIESNEEISKLEFELDEISKRLVTGNKQSELKSKLKYLEDSMKQKDDAVQDILKKLNDRYKKIVGSDVDIDVAEVKFNEKLVQLTLDMEEQQRKVFSLESELESEKRSREAIFQSRDENNKKTKQLKLELLEVIQEDEINDYETVVENLEDDYRNVMEDVNTAEVTKKYGDSAMEVAKKNNCCLLCKRTFNKDELERFIEDLRRGFDEKKTQEVKMSANEIGKELEETKKIGLKIVTYRECLSLKATFETQIESADAKINHVNELLKQEKSKHDLLKSNVDSANLLKKPLSDATRLNSESLDLAIQIDDLNDELESYGAGPATLTVAQLQAQQQEVNKKIKGLRVDLNECTEQKFKAQRDLQKLEGKIKDTKLVISNLERSLAEVHNVKKSIKDIETAIEQAEMKIAGIQEKLEELRKEKQMEFEKLSEIQRLNSLEEESLQRNTEQISKIYSDFINLKNAIEEYETNDKTELEKNTVEMENTIQEIEFIKQKINHLSQQIKVLEKEVMDSSRIEHNIIANIDYRLQIHKLDETDFQINAMDIENAQVKKLEYQEHSRRLRDELSELTSQHAGKIGEVKQIKDQIEGLKKELETEYKNVNELYHEEWIKLQTNLLVSNDIQNYSKALDNAIMKFHSIKMEDINRILGDLWSQTYKGSDISTIAIKSDVNLQAKGNRSYNYRVVMVKDNSELDMRGRCSAGQKVLASILIRLALAECFGANCGMIALDEPTTNLDNENAEALALALNRIIEYRKQQLNFQLIVITHDEKFLTHIQGDRFTDHFYRIQRDEKAKSRIYSLPISRIQEY